MRVDIDLQLADTLGPSKPELPEISVMAEWINTALELGGRNADTELTVRFTEAEEIRELNREYRHIDKSTNILSFPFECPPEVELPLIGDLVICHEILVKEAAEQQITVTAHLAHLLVHGALHLIGYDHIEDNEAEEMEGLEIKALSALGFANPYE